MHCISLVILRRLSRFPSPAAGTNWPFCVDVPLNNQSINQSINLSYLLSLLKCSNQFDPLPLAFFLNLGLESRQHFVLQIGCPMRLELSQIVCNLLILSAVSKPITKLCTSLLVSQPCFLPRNTCSLEQSTTPHNMWTCRAYYSLAFLHLFFPSLYLRFFTALMWQQVSSTR